MGKNELTYRRRPLGFRLKKYRLLLPFVLIGVAYYFIFNYIPIIWGFMISLKDMKVGSTISNAPWVGLEHYRYVLNDPEMFKLLRNTLTISIARLVFTFFPPILLTIIIFDLRSTLFKKFGQTLVYIPHFFSWVIIYGIVFAFFSESGFINILIGKLGGSTYPYMTSSKAFVPLLVGSQVWKEAGWGTILYCDALTGVNPELCEAAKIDGAGDFGIFIRIGVPLGRPGIFSVVILSFLEYWNAVEQPLTYLKTESLKPLSLYLPVMVKGEVQTAFAASIITLLPAVLLFFCGQESLEKGIGASGSF